MTTTLSGEASIVIPTHNEGENLRRTVDALLGTAMPGSEVIVIDDGSTDGSTDFLYSGYRDVRVVKPAERLGALRARNYGAALATRPFIVFADAHVAPSPGWPKHFADALSELAVAAVGPGIDMMGRPGATGYGHVWSDAHLSWHWLSKKGQDPYEVPMLPGCFYALRRDVFDVTGGFDAGLLIWGTGDAELSFRLWLLGYRCLMVPSVNVAHQFKKARNFSLNWELMLHNVLRTATVHLGQKRLTQVVAAMNGHRAFPSAFARLMFSDAWCRRDELRRTRIRDDDWYFDYFDIHWPTEGDRG
ncbi:glycosyltransferase [Streptomyces sp. NPDC015032]|uniref:glycosyltransferase n=1 Tax=Streptomyces sp. NPDC015032 TaxID=3364937 RepID=UPI0036FD5B3D